MKTLHCAFALLAAAVFAAPSLADLSNFEHPLAYEPFTGTPGALLETAAGSSGIGWQNPTWGVRNNNQGPGTQSVVAGGLGYTDADGNVLFAQGNHAHALNPTGNSQYFRHVDLGGAFNQSLGNFVGDGNAYYMSYIFERQGVSDEVWIDTMHGGDPNVVNDPTPTNSYSRNAQLNLISPPTSAGGVNGGNEGELGNINETTDTWRFRSKSIDAESAPPVPFSYNQQFVVAKVTHAGGLLGADLVEVWLDPILTSEGLAGAPDMTADIFDGTNPYNLNQTGLGMWLGGGNNARAPAEAIFDEIRVGTSWESVTPHNIPEPGTVVLLGLGGVALVAGYRRCK